MNGLNKIPSAGFFVCGGVGYVRVCVSENYYTATLQSEYCAYGGQYCYQGLDKYFPDLFSRLGILNITCHDHNNLKVQQ